MEWFMNTTVWQTIGRIAAIVTTLSVFIEFIPIKVHPITALLSWIGKRTNKELFDKVELLEEKIVDIDDNQKSLEAEIAKRDAINCRVRILRFADELRTHVKHSQESFEQVLDDIDVYEKYCTEHPEFQNNKTVRAKERIKATYDGCMEQDDFL